MKIKIDSSKLARIRKLVTRLSNGTVSGLWDAITAWLTAIKDKLFDEQGGSYGRKKWPPISPTLYGKLRRGSDGNIHGRYSSGSLPLQASRKYRESFKVKTSPKVMTYGSRHKLADKIPYAGWNRKDGRYDPRYALPDMTDRRTTKELNQIVKKTIKEWLKTEVK